MTKIYRSKILTYIVVLLIQQSKCEATSLEREKEIAALEKEKGELYKQINSAIDESVTLLNKTNDTHAVMGTSFLKQLKTQLKEINETGVPFHAEEIQGRFLNETRRKDFKMDLFDIAKVSKKKKYYKGNDREKDQEIMQKKVNEWLAQKELEKKKIREYKHNLKEKNKGMKREKCPRDGVGKSDKKNDAGKKSHKYPCCRKCCKKSYMGCL